MKTKKTVICNLQHLRSQQQTVNGLVQVAVWRSGSALVLLTEVNLRRARLVLGWVTVSWFDSRGDTLFRYVASHPG